MAKVITFSTKYPKGHRDAGKPTEFVEKIWSGLLQIDNDLYSDYLHPDGRPDQLKSADYYKEFTPKFHTIRAGKRWKEGDKFSPRIWTGKPYNSKQFQFAPDLEIVKVYDFNIRQYRFIVDGNTFYWQHQSQWHAHMEELCKNDGLSFGQFLDWFKIPCDFEGQILCWDNKIKY